MCSRAVNIQVPFCIRLDLTSGVVLDIGREKVTCVAVHEGNECSNSLSCVN